MYTAGADGSLRSWSVERNTGAMAEWASHEAAHDGRICVLQLHGSFLYSSGVDGVIRAWSKDTLELIAQVCVPVSVHSGSHKTNTVPSIHTRSTLTQYSYLFQVPAAHGGDKVQCLAVGGNGVLYSGGDDRMIRAWLPGSLRPLPGFEALEVRGAWGVGRRWGKTQCLGLETALTIQHE